MSHKVKSNNFYKLALDLAENDDFNDYKTLLTVNCHLLYYSIVQLIQNKLITLNLFADQEDIRSKAKISDIGYHYYINSRIKERLRLNNQSVNIYNKEFTVLLSKRIDADYKIIFVQTKDEFDEILKSYNYLKKIINGIK